MSNTNSSHLALSSHQEVHPSICPQCRRKRKALPTGEFPGEIFYHCGPCESSLGRFLEPEEEIPIQVTAREQDPFGPLQVVRML